MPTPEKRYAKGEQRREQLLRAAIAIVAEQGVAGITHRAVTERAGVPYTSIAYFFGSIEQLGIEAVELAAEELTARLEALAASLAAERTAPAAIAAQFGKLLAAFPKELELARYEVLLQAARLPEHSSALSGIVRSIERLAQAALKAAGARNPAEGARAFAALAEGLNLHHLVAPRPDDVEAASRAYRALFLAYVIDEDELARWNQRLDSRGATDDA